MAVNEWRGDAQNVAQVARFTIGGAPAAGNTVSITRNGKSATYTVIAGDVIKDVANGMAAAWSAATFPESKECEVDDLADDDAFFDLVAATPGQPFSLGTAATGGGATITQTAITASAGESDIGTLANWTLGAIPSGADAVLVRGGAPMLYGLGSVTCGSWEFRASYTGPVGLPKWNVNGYYEDRARELTINGTVVNIGTGDGTGASEMHLKLVAGTTCKVEKSGFRSGDVPSIDLNASGTVTLVEVSGGADVGIMVEDESTARTFTRVAISGDDTKVTTGRRSTITTYDHDSGTTDAYGIVTTPTIGRGDYTQHEGGMTTLNARGGTVNLNAEMTIATVNALGRGSGDPGPVINCEANNYPRTFTNSTFTGGGYLLDENKSVTLDAGGTHTADSTFFANARLGPVVTWNRV